MTLSTQISNPPIAWSAALHTLARQHEGRVAVQAAEGPMSYRSLCALAHGVARVLLEREAGAGVRVATCLPNGLGAVRAAYGVRLSGAAEVPLNWGQTIEETAWCAQVAGFEYVLTTQDRHESMTRAGLKPLVIEAIEAWPDAPTLPAVPGDAPGRLMFTSGTTGRPRAAVYTHARRWVAEQLLKATLPFRPMPGERLLLMTPFSHGASLLTFAWCDDGGDIVLLDGVDARQVLARLRHEPITAMFAPPTVLAKVLAAPDEGSGPAAPWLRCILTGTQPLPATLYRKVRERFGPVVRVTYGKAECFNPITVLPPDATEALLGGEDAPASGLDGGVCVGWPAPGVELDIRPAEAAAADERSGEIWIRAAHMSNGMLGPEGYTPHPDGWHRSGDLGHIDAQGRLVLTGRVADVIKTGGYRVNPQEIEAALSGVMAEDRLCITSIPSEYWGEIIVAVAEDPPEGWEGDAAARLSAVSRHKRPRAYLPVERLPRNAQGKVLRRAASRLVLDGFRLVDGPYPRLEPRAGKEPPAQEAGAGPRA